MKKLVILFFVSTLLSLKVAFATQDETVNFVQTNPILKAILDEVIQDDSLMARLDPEFDEAVSNLSDENPKLKYDLTGELKNTPWSPDALVNIKVSSTYEVNRTQFHSGILSTLDATVNTKTLAFLQHAGKLGRKNLEDLSGEFKASIDQLLQQLSKVETLEQFQSLVLKGQELVINQAIQDISTKLEELNKIHRRKNIDDSYPSRMVEIGRLNLKIEELRRRKDSVISTQVRSEQSDESTVIQIDNLNVEKFVERAPEFIKSGEVHLKFSSQFIQVSSKVFIAKPISDVNQLKASISRTLLGVQNRRQAERTEVQKIYRDALIAIKKVIKHGNVHESLESM